ncbi:WYL domain-containing protein [Leifsonia kafniensis]|uniref:WYL domain-containing protein n=1 Tax=Leifsonia kafniensis TaxID=475957 RepID=A0ABP7KWJ5_9MICO
MRADRLVATLLMMQAKGRVTAREVAAEFETSVATVRRDFEALSAAGIPVYPQVGRGGGWQLLGGARTDLTGLTSAEARALFLLVGPAASVAPEVKSALRKLVRALPETFRTDAEAAAEAVVIDPARWGRPRRAEQPLVKALQDAVVQRRKVRLSYRGWDRDPDESLCDPWGMVEKDGVWYLLGGVDGTPRTYRIERIVESAITNEPADRPENFDLTEAWNAVVRDVTEQRERASATVVTSIAIVPFLRHQFGESAVIETGNDSERVTVRISAPSEIMLARGLAGWGADIEVLEPAAVRAELIRIGAALLERNAPEKRGLL